MVDPQGTQLLVGSSAEEQSYYLMKVAACREAVGTLVVRGFLAQL